MMRWPLLVATALALPARLPAQTDADFFERKVRPVLVEHCFACHGPEKQRGGIRLDARTHLVKPRDEGTLVVPGQPEKSGLLKAVKHEGEYKMPPPPKAKLSPAVIDDLTQWIKLGAVWPESKIAVDAAGAWKKHWAFQPVRRPPLPTVKDNAWAADNPIDAFILHKLEQGGLTPSATAEPRTLVRRLHFDLVGLPPTAAEVEEFVAAWEGASAKRQALLEKTVDRLLAAPQFGERWGRYWLDVARYADSKGYVFMEERRYPFAYTYRDYVIDAFNRDLPFDRFIVEQVAADRLVARKEAEPKVQAALGYLTLGRRFLNNVHDIIDDRIDVVTRGFMGLTVQCARCHDHKYDPIPARDYYSLYGVFASSQEPRELPIIGTPPQTAETAAFQKSLGSLQSAVKSFEEANKKELAERNRKVRDQLRALQKKVDAFLATAPGSPPRAMVLVDAPQPAVARVFLRGNPNSPGPTVPRQSLEVLAGVKREPFKDGSGRLELAQAIASKDNPLTSRVFVNRAWLHLMGAGLVSTPSDFGLRADPPSHPELLDHLAANFMDDGWSMKRLIRRIVLSRTYQQTSRLRLSETAAAPLDDRQADGVAKPQAADPENRLLAHANRRRLDFEAMRDALLAVAGNLDLKQGGPTVDFIKNPLSGRRTLYGFVDRQNLPGMMRTFDFPNPDATSPQRYQTTVPQQALFLLNSPFVIEQARGVVRRVSGEATLDPDAKIQRLHRLLYGRPAQPDEVRLGQVYLGLPSADGGTTPWERYAQVLMLSNEFMFVD